ncbi:isoleucine--tRNA ligase [Allosphingosinicella indica]|uniref:Isoleucine--tRNA ligase n=1 Tax=Allosphingosinicella indica TaxID=941907 RepID=A0A1X7GFY6_9SPHN|nr:isoleucine--tRNA ligase [Allosphingosinicella indica]SMF69231.1 Isoleucyl-tRNA synthetase [Allosphingosinicella indica]
MSDESPTQDWRDTVFLPKTDFPMKAGLAQKEPAILARWEQEKLYEQLRAARAGRTRFILHDGPPYANGDLHMGHAMNKVLKDIIVRSRSLMGKDAPYIPGWDCHGLPIEWKVEEQYRKKKLDKDEVPKAQFRAECRAYADKWVGVQREQFQRLGVMGEWDDPYLTMAYEAEATIAAELLKFAESGQLYRGAKPVMWSPVEKTALADAEVEYEDITSTQIDVAFEIVESPIPELIGAHAVVWTTTPWTIPVNQALAYGPEIAYVLASMRPIPFSDDEPPAPDRKVLVAKHLIDAIEDRLLVTLTQIKRIEGSDLAGTVARHPMHHLGGFFAKPRPFLPGEFVTTDAGTGLVHMAPDHGEDDFDLCKAHGIGPVFAVTDDGKYRPDWAWLGGQGSVINPKFNAPDGPICTDLREAGALLAASADFKHSYPHSWRSKAKVIFRCTPQWFIPMDLSTAGLDRLDPALETSGVKNAKPLISSSVERSRDATVERSPSNHPTLRGIALDAIENTRWVPERSKNRIRAMVEGRPDWVISRQRAWGVPIALYVHRKSGEYLVDPAVNARIVAAFRQGGADAWFTADHQALLGPDYDLADYEPVNDILDVWFDSGSTHAFVIEARYGEGVRADLYIEGSDQHRGWFQSSLLESAGTRGRAPYDAVLTHGFALDAQGRKMSKSVGNVVDPLAIIRDNGADILRLWVASTDYFEDVRIGKEVLSGTTDMYRKLRNSFRYLLGALDGFDDAERVAPAAMPELERYILHRVALLDAELKAAVEAFEFNRYVRALTNFANDDLSAFFFDIRKDSLYCDAPGDPKRRAYRTVLDILFHALVRWAAPIIPFTAEEVWQTRFPDCGSVHLLEWPEVDAAWRDEALGEKWELLRGLRIRVTEAIEPMRRDKVVGSSLAANVAIELANPDLVAIVKSLDFAEVCIVSGLAVAEGQHDRIAIEASDRHKCGRCWRLLPEVTEDGALCGRCDKVVHG